MASLEEIRARGKGQNSAAALEEIRARGKGPNYFGGLARSGAQGLAFGFGDEIEAAVRSLGKREYADLLQDVRGEIKKFESENPKVAITSEITGAVLPSLVAAFFTLGSGGVAATSATAARIAARNPSLMQKITSSVGSGINKSLGTSATSTLKGGATVGAIQGGITGAGKGEGFEERILGGGAGIPIGAGLGFVGQGATTLASKFLSSYNKKRGQMASDAAARAIDQIRRDGNLTVEDVVQGVIDGTIMTENKTLLDAVRVFRAKGGPASTNLKNALEPRKEQTKQAAMEAINSSLSSRNLDDNLIKQMQMDKTSQQISEEIDYKKLRGQQTTGEVQDALLDSLNRVPSAKKEVDEAFRARTGSDVPLYNPATDEAPASFSRVPDIYEAEKIRKAIGNTASDRFNNPSGRSTDAGEAIAEQEKILRNVLDESSDALKTTRSSAALNRNVRDYFEKGNMATRLESDQVRLDFEMAQELGPEVVQAYREGYMRALKKQSEARGGGSLMPSLNNPQLKDNAVLGAIIPENSYDEVMRAVNAADLSSKANSTILKGSDTAVTLGNMQRQASPSGLLQDASDLATNPSGLMVRKAGDALETYKKWSSGLSDKDRIEVVEILTSTDPEVVKQALTNAQLLSEVIESRSSRLGQSFRKALNVGGSGEIIDNGLEYIFGGQR